MGERVRCPETEPGRCFQEDGRMRVVTQGQDCKWTVGFPELRAISDGDKALAVEEQDFQLKSSGQKE